jgi:glycosyltransferase involved in cell wall biosynthesis
MSSATIVIAATGQPVLEQAVRSALAQQHQDLRVWVIIDGPEYRAACQRIAQQFSDARLSLCCLPENTGANGFYGHRIYAASGHLVNSEYVLLLDQDNWLQADHVSSLISAIKTNGWHWAHSLRRIHDRTGVYLCDDDCESLGRYPIYLNDQAHLVDTSCYCMRREVFQAVSAAWHWGWGGDRRFLAAISQHFTAWGSSGKYTLNYRLDGNAGSVTREFFDQGNAVMRQRYPAGFPWAAGTQQKTLDKGSLGASVSV